MHNLILSPLSLESLTEAIALKTIELWKLSEKKQQSESKLYSVKELSVYAGVSELTIRNWIIEGKIEAKRIGRRILIDQNQFERGLSEVKSLKYKR